MGPIKALYISLLTSGGIANHKMVPGWVSKKSSCLRILLPNRKEVGLAVVVRLSFTLGFEAGAVCGTVVPPSPMSELRMFMLGYALVICA